MPGMSEKEKERAKLLGVYDLTKKFVDRLSTLLELEDSEWDLLRKKMTLSDNKLGLKFQLKEAKLDELIDKLDKAQKKIDDFETEDLETIPNPKRINN